MQQEDTPRFDYLVINILKNISEAYFTLIHIQAKNIR